MKPRNREVNIFNMSLLDILCGALGAFCFMMLSLLPYYRPGTVEVSREQKELLDELQKIKDLSERLKSASTAEDLTELVEQLRKQIAALEARIKQLQGQVNALYAENKELKARVAKLEEEAKRLRSRNQQLETENQQLQHEKRELLAKNDQLERRNQQLEAEKDRLQQEKEKLQREKESLDNRLKQKLPWQVTVTSHLPGVTLDCSLHEQVIAADTGAHQDEFNPKLDVQPAGWTGDYRIGGAGSVTRISADRAPGSVMKLYIRMTSPPREGVFHGFRISVTGGDLEPLAVPTVDIPPGRQWIFAGTFRTESLKRISYTPATKQESEAEWQRLMNLAPPKVEEPPADGPKGPGFERRKKEYEAVAVLNPPTGVRINMLTRWLHTAESDEERKYVATLLNQAEAEERRKTAPTPAAKERTPGDTTENAGSGPARDSEMMGRFEMERRAKFMTAISKAGSKEEKIAILKQWTTSAETNRERAIIKELLDQLNERPAQPAAGPAVPFGVQPR